MHSLSSQGTPGTKLGLPAKVPAADVLRPIALLSSETLRICLSNNKPAINRMGFAGCSLLAQYKGEKKSSNCCQLIWLAKINSGCFQVAKSSSKTKNPS